MKTRLLTLALLLCGSLAYGAQLTINLGTSPTGSGGDNNRQAFTKVNTNFAELYTSVADLTEDLTLMQPLDADLTAIAALTTTTYGRSLLTLADANAGRTSLGLAIGTDVQAFDSDLSTYAGITPSANAQSLLGAASYAAMRGLLDLEAGTDFNAYSANLAQLAALSDPNADRILFWDDSAGSYTHLTLGTGLSITGTTINSTGSLDTTAIDTSAELAAILTDETGTGNFVLSSVTDALDTRLDAVETDVWEIADPAADAIVYWNDTSNAVETMPVDSKSGTHASPSTTNPLAPTWTGLMHVVWYGATGEIDLPTAATYAGRSILIYNTGAFTVTIDPNGSEVIVRDGTVQTGGVTMTLSSGAGNFVGLISDGVRWITLGYKGTLTVGS